jgi:ATP-dependent DNA helicase RecQ
MGHVIDVLRGAHGQKIAERGHDRLSVYGVGADQSKDAWASILRQLIHRGYLVQDIAAYSVLKLTDAAWPILRSEETLRLARPRIRVKAEKQRKAGAPGGLAPTDRSLFERLRALRKRIAADQGVPPFVVFGDKSLLDMAARRPATPKEFLEVHGVGNAKLERYGDEFMAVINDRGNAG